jgi:hypothetical protein
MHVEWIGNKTRDKGEPIKGTEFLRPMQYFILRYEAASKRGDRAEDM